MIALRRKQTLSGLLAAILVVLLSVLSGCGDDESADDTNNEISRDAGRDDVSDSTGRDTDPVNDAGDPDAANPDAANPDAANPDAANPDATDPDATSPPPTGQAIVSVDAVSQADQDQSDVPMTFGQIFVQGAVGADQTLTAAIDGQPIPTQVDKKASWPDGSLRHAVISVRIPTLAANASAEITLKTADMPDSDPTAVTLDNLLETDFEAQASVDIAGATHTASARDALDQANQAGCDGWGKRCKRWLSGPLVSEWLVDAAGGDPHLQVYFHVRAYAAEDGTIDDVRVDTVLENNWAYQNFDGTGLYQKKLAYSATLSVGDDQSFSVDDLSHYRQARWHHRLWWHEKPAVYPKLDTEYIQQSKAVSNYKDLSPPEDYLNDMNTNVAPMKNGWQTDHMGATGAQASIGPLPKWTSTYIVSSDKRAFDSMLANDDGVGSYSFHYRDAATGRPIKITDHPKITIGGRRRADDLADPADDLLPTCNGSCGSPYSFNISHHPSSGYVPYLVTGDFYYLEEMQFTGTYVLLWKNSSYRQEDKGILLPHGQVRGHAWSLRAIGEAAFLTPDDDPMKDYFVQLVQNNIEDLNARFTDSSKALHVVHHAIYPLHGQERVGIAPWQQDFFTWSVGHLAELGFDGADRIIEWFAHFQVGRMTDWQQRDAGFCWLQAAAYKIQLRDTRDGDYYDSLDEVYAATFPNLVDVECNSQAMIDAWGGSDQIGEMSGYPFSATGFPSNMQIGLAMASDSGIDHAEEAWDIFANERTVRPEGSRGYAYYPNFAVVPRHVDQQ